MHTRTSHACRILLTCLVLVCSVGYASAWNTGPGDSPTDANIDHDAGQQYHRSPHVYIFEHAIEILRNDGNDNWANLAEAHMQDLADGARYADHCMGRGYIRVQLEVLWGLWSENLYEESYPLAGREHYYNPDRAGSGSEGLDLSDISGWASFLDGFVKFLSSYVLRDYTLGAVDLDIDFSPALQGHYASAAGLSQQKYDLALAAWRQGQSNYQRGSLGTAFFNLGWSCHFVQDQAVPNHTHDSYMSNHQEYEDFADGRGGQAGIHATNGGQYQYGARAYDFCAGCAGLGHPSNLFSAVKSGGSQWPGVLQVSLPAAERYTAGLIAKFMTELQIPPKTPPATFITASSNAPSGDLLPGAYIFYRRDGETKWNLIRSDANGSFSLNCPPNVKFWVRPAMPGYNFWGSTTLASDDVLQNQCPIPYTQHPGVFSGTLGRIVLQRQPGPQMMMPNLGGPAMNMKTILQTAPEHIGGQLQMAGTGPNVLQAGTQLPLSGTQVEQHLEDDIRAAALDVKVTSHILGVPNSGTGLPTSARVDLQVYELMSIMTGQVITSGPALTQAIDANRAKLIQVASSPMQQAAVQQVGAGQFMQQVGGQVQPVGQGQQATVQGQQPVGQGQQATGQAILDPKMMTAWQNVRTRLDTKQVMCGDNQQRQVFVIPSHDGSHFGGHKLLQNGVIPVPTLQGCQVTVTPVSGYGYLGFSTQPITIQTDASGKASFTVNAGSHAGKLRLKIAVNNPNINFLQPVHYTEFMIHPALTGSDPAQVTPPMLMQTIQPIQATPLGGGQQVVQMVTTPQTVQRVRIRYDGSRLVGLARENALALGAQVPTTMAQAPTGQQMQQVQPIQQQPGMQQVQPIQQQPGMQQAQPVQQQPGMQQAQPVQQQPGMQPMAPIQPTGGAVLTESFDGQSQNWELAEGATISGGALTFNQPGMAFWLTPPVAQPLLRFKYRPGQGAGTVGFCVSGEPPNSGEYDLLMMPGEMGLMRQQGNQRSELGGAMAQMQQGWNDMAITMSGNTIQVYVNGQQVITAQDPVPLAAGIVRLGSHEGGGTAFDDLQLSGSGTAPPMAGGQQPTQPQAPTDDERPPQMAPVQGEQVVQTPPIMGEQPGGQQMPGMPQQPLATGAGISENFDAGQPQGWEMPPSASVQNGALTFNGSGYAYFSVGTMQNFRLSFRYMPGNGMASVVMCAGGDAQNAANYTLMMPPDQMGFDFNSGGQCQPLAGGPMQWQQGQWHTVVVQVSNGQAQVSVNGQVVRNATVPRVLQGGRFGVGMLEGSGAAFDDINLTPLN